jgi:hypothetical protein
LSNSKKATEMLTDAERNLKVIETDSEKVLKQEKIQIKNQAE